MQPGPTWRARRLRRARPRPRPPLVLGFGNVLLSDDGAGVKLVERLRSELGRRRRGVRGRRHAELQPAALRRGDRLDAGDRCRRSEQRAGNGIACSKAPQWTSSSRAARRRTVHEVGLIDLLDMARLQDCLPRRRALLCIQPGRIDWSETLSTPVARGVTRGRAASAGNCCSAGSSRESPHRNPDPDRAVGADRTPACWRVRRRRRGDSYANWSPCSSGSPTETSRRRSTCAACR